MQRDVLII